MIKWIYPTLVDNDDVVTIKKMLVMIWNLMLMF